MLQRGRAVCSIRGVLQGMGWNLLEKVHEGGRIQVLGTDNGEDAHRRGFRLHGKGEAIISAVGEKIADAAWSVLMLNPVRVLLGLLFLVAISSNLGANYYAGKWVGFGAVFIAILGVEFVKRFGWLAALTISYILAHILWFVVYPDTRYAPVNPYDLTALKFYTAESGLKLLLILAPLMLIRFRRESLKQDGGWLVCLFAVVNLWQIYSEAILRGCRDVNSCGGVLANPSMNATMAAMALPFVFQYFSKPFAWLTLCGTVGAALLGGSSIGLGMIAAFLAVKNPKFLLASPFILGLGLWKWGALELFNSSDRLPMWKFFMEQWAKNPVHWWFGTGFGTFGVFSINLQNAHDFKSQYWWVWLHNDWLQALFETGFVGLTLMLGTFLHALKRLWERKETAELQALLLFGLAMMLNFPLHIGLTCAFGAWLLTLALQRNQPDNKPKEF